MEKQYIFPRRKAAASGGPPLQFFSKWGLQKAKHMRKMQKITRIKKIWVEQNMTLQFLTQNFPRRKSLLFMMCLRHLFPWLCNWRKNSNFTSYRPEIHCKSWTAQYHKLSTTQDGRHSCREYYDICLVSGVTLWSELQPDTCDSTLTAFYFDCILTPKRLYYPWRQSSKTWETLLSTAKD